MATRSRIAIERPGERYDSIYCHWDGYPSHNGKILLEHYTDPAKVEALLDLGQISILGAEIGEKHFFDTPSSEQASEWLRDFLSRHEEFKQIIMAEEVDPKALYDQITEDWTTAYIRDRGEDPTRNAAKRGQTWEALEDLAAESWAEYLYVFRDGEWWIFDNGGLVPLTPEYVGRK